MNVFWGWPIYFLASSCWFPGGYPMTNPCIVDLPTWINGRFLLSLTVGKYTLRHGSSGYWIMVLFFGMICLRCLEHVKTYSPKWWWFYGDESHGIESVNNQQTNTSKIVAVIIFVRYLRESKGRLWGIYEEPMVMIHTVDGRNPAPVDR